MHLLEEYSYIWQADKDKYVLLNDELGNSIFFIKEKEIMFFLVEDDALYELIISKMMEHGNKVYNSIEEIQKDIGIRGNVSWVNIIILYPREILNWKEVKNMLNFEKVKEELKKWNFNYKNNIVPGHSTYNVNFLDN